MMETIFVVQGYERKIAETGELVDSCLIEVYASNEKEAIKKAANYVKKTGYRVSNVIEKKT